MELAHDIELVIGKKLNILFQNEPVYAIALNGRIIFNNETPLWSLKWLNARSLVYVVVFAETGYLFVDDRGLGKEGFEAKFKGFVPYNKETAEQLRHKFDGNPLDAEVFDSAIVLRTKIRKLHPAIVEAIERGHTYDDTKGIGVLTCDLHQQIMRALKKGKQPEFDFGYRLHEVAHIENREETLVLRHTLYTVEEGIRFAKSFIYYE